MGNYKYIIKRFIDTFEIKIITLKTTEKSHKNLMKTKQRKCIHM